MEEMNTPALETERLTLRKFRREDVDALYALYSDREVNRFLPWFPLASREEAERLLEREYQAVYARPRGCRYAVCLKGDGLPVGYVHLEMEAPYDLGYALLRPFWGRGIAAEAARRAAEWALSAGVPYITATHDVNNPRSGGVMRALGMRYQYTYVERWQPKDFPVAFRLYQLGGTGYRGYWDRFPQHYIERL